MSWFETTTLASISKNAFKEAQKKIDEALDIHDEHTASVGDLPTSPFSSTVKKQLKESSENTFANFGISNEADSLETDESTITISEKASPLPVTPSEVVATQPPRSLSNITEKSRIDSSERSSIANLSAAADSSALVNSTQSLFLEEIQEPFLIISEKNLNKNDVLVHQNDDTSWEWESDSSIMIISSASGKEGEDLYLSRSESFYEEESLAEDSFDTEGFAKSCLIVGNINSDSSSINLEKDSIFSTSPFHNILKMNDNNDKVQPDDFLVDTEQDISLPYTTIIPTFTATTTVITTTTTTTLTCTGAGEFPETNRPITSVASPYANFQYVAINNVMNNVNNVTSSNADYFIGNSVHSANVQRPMKINIERLFYHRTNIPLLIGYDNFGEWKGITVEAWLSLLNDYFMYEHICSDAEKLAAYRRFLDPNGSARAVIQAFEELKNSQTWLEFSNGILNMLSPLTADSCFESFAKWKELDWKKGVVFQTFCALVQTAIENFEKNVMNSFGTSFSPKMKKIMVFATIYSYLPKELQHNMVEYFDINLSYSDQVGTYMTKTANALLCPFKNSAVTTKKSTTYNTVSSLQSSGGKSTPRNRKQNSGNQTRNSRNKTSNLLRIDPQNTPKGKNGECFGHRNADCAYRPYCSLCRDYHSRGAIHHCTNTSLDFGAPEALKRVKNFSPTRGRNNRPNQPRSNITNQPNNWRNSNSNCSVSRNREQENYNSNYKHPQQLSISNYNTAHYNNSPQQSIIYTAQRNNFQPTRQNLFNNRQPLYYIMDNIPLGNESDNINLSPQPTEFYNPEYNEFTNSFNNMSFSSTWDEQNRISSP